VGRFQAWRETFADIERLAMVGEKKWQKSWLSFAGHLPLLRFGISSAAI
jgi:hypothetical protein